MSDDEGVVYISQTGTFWAAPEITADTLRTAIEDECYQEQMEKTASKIFNGMYRLTVQDPDGEEDEDLSDELRSMVESRGVMLWSRMKQCWEDIRNTGAFICRPMWARDGGATMLSRLMRFDPFSFDTAPSAYMGNIYCDLLQGVVLNDAGDTEFYQMQEIGSEPVKLKPGVVLLKDPASTKLGGSSKAVYAVPLIKMRTYCADAQMQKVKRIAAPIIFIKVTNPIGDDRAYAQQLLKNWDKDTAFQLRPNMEVVTLDLTDNETALNTIHWLEGRIAAPFRGASNLDKEGSSIGGNAAAQKDESDDWIAGQRTMIEDLFEGLLSEWLERNAYEGYSIEIQIAVKAAQPGDIELRQAQLGYQSRTLSVNEVRERLGAPEKSIEELAEMAAEWDAAIPKQQAPPADGDLFGDASLEEIREKAAALGAINSIDPVDPERYLSMDDQLKFLGLKHGKSG